MSGLPGPKEFPTDKEIAYVENWLDWIKETVDRAPPLSRAQLDKIAVLLGRPPRNK